MKKEFPKWKKLIEAAERWKHNDKMNMQKKSEEFIKFSVDKVKKSGITP